jgi:transposase
MGRKPKQVQLTPEEDQQLYTLEQQPGIRAKVRLRAQAVRLSAKGWTIPQLAQHLHRHPESIRQDLQRWERHNVAGLADGVAPGKPPSFTPEMEGFLHQKLAEERTWNCTTLAEALEERFGIRLGREALRLKLQALGYRWKRTRYIPSRQPDSQAEARAREELAELKRGPVKVA